MTTGAPSTPSGDDLDRYLPAVASGDADAFGAWMAHAERPVRDSLQSFAARVDTESVVQETFLRVWQVAPRVQTDAKPNALLRLALRIGRNLAISETRRLRTVHAYQNRVEVAADASGPQTVGPPDPMLRRVIAGCRERLPAKPAQALGARLDSAGGKADRALADMLGMRTNTFLQNLTRARKLLAACLAEHGVDLRAELG
ncbi:MAG: hypothetical protein Tsb0020_13340 [Haliangiales bacterium]